MNLRWIIVAAFVAITFSACGASNMQRVIIGEDTFLVPSERLLSANVEFLPSSQNDALRFILNPRDADSDQILVSVQSASVLCKLSGTKYSNYRGKTCDSNRKMFFRPPLHRSDVKYSGGTLWEYFDSDGIRVVTCSKGKGAGNCTADGRFMSTIFSIHFQGNRINDLSYLMNEVVDTLSKWHVQSGE